MVTRDSLQMASSLSSAQSVISTLQTAIADQLLEGEQEVFETPALQMSVSKIGAIANGTSLTAGGSSVKFPAGADFDGCVTVKVCLSFSFHVICIRMPTM